MRTKSKKSLITHSLVLASTALLITGISHRGLTQTPERKFLMPAPKYAVRLDKSVRVPMRDGVKLSTDIYFPEGAQEKLPTIIIRTPYNKNTWRDAQRDGVRYAPYMFAEQGFVVLYQDCRGTYESEGEYIPFVTDLNDGNDTINWTIAQPWSNGKVGRYGCSYLSETIMIEARSRNPAVKALITQSSPAIGTAGNRYRFFGFLNGGALELAATVGWFALKGSKIYYRPPPGISRELFLEIAPFFNIAPTLPNFDLFAILKTLPIIDMHKKLGAPPSDFEDFVSHEPNDPWWDQFGLITDKDRFDVPALHIGSWYDGPVADRLFAFNLLRRHSLSKKSTENQFAIISPTLHCRSEVASENTLVGDRSVGDAQLDHWGIYVKWFDYWLKGIDNGITQMPKLQIYTMGKNEWRAEQNWPLERTKFTEYYFHSDGHANSRLGTGLLNVKKPGKEPPDSFTYDPKTPVPSYGGAICSGCTGNRIPAGSFDHSDIEMRHDILVYTTPVLKKGIEVTGPIKAVLYVSSSAKDTDFTVKLIDVYGDGSAFNVQEGILRARYREGFDKKVWMKPENIYKLNVNVHATSNFFPAGHRIRVEISSSNFPRFDRNLNTGGNNFDETEGIVAVNSIHHSKAYPSHILLPVIESIEK